MVAERGLPARELGNWNCSRTGTRSVSDSFLKPAKKRGMLRIVKEVEIMGEEYVRIAGREDEVTVSLNWFRSDRISIKFPSKISQTNSVKDPNRGCVASLVVQAPRTQHKVGCSRDLRFLGPRFPKAEHPGYGINRRYLSVIETDGNHRT